MITFYERLISTEDIELFNYDNILLSDYINSILSYNNENILSMLMIFQIIIPILLLKNNYNEENLNTIIFNKYISKSIIYTHNNTLFNIFNTLNTLNYKLIIELQCWNLNKKKMKSEGQVAGVGPVRGGRWLVTPEWI